MIPNAIEVRLSRKERAELEARLRAATTIYSAATDQRRRREAFDPGARARTGLPKAAERTHLTGHSHDYKRNGTTTLWHHNAVCRLRGGDRQGQGCS